MADERDEIIRELVAALEEIARVDVGGLQGIREEHDFDAADYDKDAAIEKLREWHSEETLYLLARIRHRQIIARAALTRAKEQTP